MSMSGALPCLRPSVTAVQGMVVPRDSASMRLSLNVQVHS